jgi:flagellar hook-associated protein 2
MLSAMSSVFGTNTVNSLIALGITASTASDGTITLDADKLGNVLNSNFDQVVLFFQDSESFGPTFAKTLHSLGSNDGANGGISLALSEDRRQEKMLNDNISKQEELIATQKTHLTAELSLANQILQSIPQMIQQVDEMYSAITGYHSSNNG